MIPALRYVLNLPRNALDLRERSCTMVCDLKQLDLPHDVLLAPWPIITKFPKGMLLDATLVIHPDTVPAEVVATACSGALLGIVAQRELNVELCNSHWARLADHFGVADPLRHPHCPDLNSPAQLVLNHTARLFSLPGTPLEMRRTHSYQDALLRLEQIANEFGQRKAFRRAIRDHGFLPESLFYMVIGWPEKIVLNSPLRRRIRQVLRSTVPTPIEE